MGKLISFECYSIPMIAEMYHSDVYLDTTSCDEDHHGRLIHICSETYHPSHLAAKTGDVLINPFLVSIPLFPASQAILIPRKSVCLLAEGGIEPDAEN